MNKKHDKRYLMLAKEVSTWSKDPSSQVGVVVVGDKGQVLSQGFNGFPRGIDDTIERWLDRPTKYKYVVHAEMNSIYNASYNGVSLNGSTMYVWNLPICSDCAKGIIQVGVKRVVMTQPTSSVRDKWKKMSKLGNKMFDEAGIEVTYI